MKRSTGAVVRDGLKTGQDIHMYCGPKQVQDWPRDLMSCGPKPAQDWPRDPQVLWSKTGPGLVKISTCNVVRNGLRIGQEIHRCFGPKQVQDWARYPHVLWSETGSGLAKGSTGAVVQNRYKTG